MFLMPTKAQWRSWSLPNKLTCLGAYVGILAILLACAFYLWPRSSGEPIKPTSNINVGKNSGAMGQVSGNVGDGSVVIGAQAGPASIAIGSNAHAEVANTIVVQQPDFIEGTDVTRKQLAETFPFGYAVFLLGENSRLRHEVFKTGLLEWKLDLDEVGIEPNFAEAKVTWRIPAFASGNAGTIKDFTLTYTCPLVKRAFLTSVSYSNQPAMYVGTLSGNQRKPVLVLGYRIPGQRVLSFNE